MSAPCAVCGNQLRWIPQQNAWGCDRCQRVFPAGAAPQQAPQGFAPPQPQGFGAAPSPGAAKTMFAAGAPPMRPGVGGSSPGGGSPFPPPAGASPYAPPPGASPYPPPQGASPYAPPQASPYAPPQGAPHSPPGAPYPQGAPQGGYPPPAGGAPWAPPGSPGAPPPAGAPYGAPPYGPGGAQPGQPFAPPAGQPYNPQPATAVPPVQPAGAKKGGKGLIIGLVVGVLAAGGGAAAFFLMRGGGGNSGGGSRAEVVKATLAALGAGDADKLLALSDPVSMQAKVVECKGEPGNDEEKEARDPKKQLEKQKKEWSELAPRTKGAKLELVEIVTKEPAAPTDDATPEGDDRIIKKGDDLMKGCVARVPMRFHLAKIKLKVTPPEGKSFDAETDIGLAQIGTSFWLVKPPRISLGSAALEAELGAIKDKVCACKDHACAEKLKEEFKSSPRAKEIKKEIKELSDEDKEKLDKIEDDIKACENKLEAGAQLDGLTQLKDKMCQCKDRACTDKVMQELMVWSRQFEDKDKPDPELLDKATKISEQMIECMTKVEGGDGGGAGGIGGTIVGAAGDADFPPAPQLPPECEEYRKTLVDITSCASYPQQAKQAVIDAWKTMQGMTNIPDAARQTWADTCASGTRQIRDLKSQLPGC